MSLKKLIEEITKPVIDEMGIVAGDGTIKGGSKLSKIKKMKKKGHTSVPYGSGYKKVDESKNLKLNIPNDIEKIHKLFKKNNKKLYIVGGAVRDAILGKNPKDFDLATDAKPDEVLKIAKDGGLKTTEVGKSFGVVVVGGHEIATFRKDIGKGRRPSAVDYTDIEGDVKRRDLTINALFYDIDRKDIVDLVGGIADLKKRKIRTVGKASERFDEDPLRKMRALRFHGALGGKMSKDTKQALMDNPSLKGISGERIRDEFVKSIKKAKSTKNYLQKTDELKFTDQILPGLKISKPYIDENDHILLLAWILRKNDANSLGIKLNKLRYSGDEAQNIQFLNVLQNFKPENIFLTKKFQEKTSLTDNQIIQWGKYIGKDLKKMVKFKLSVKGSDVSKDLKGREIGKAIQKLERDKFLNEAFAVRGNKVEKFITGHNLTMKGKKYKEIEFETLGVDNSRKMITLRILAPKKLFGIETPVKFSTLRRGPFTKTDTGKKIKEIAVRPKPKKFRDIYDALPSALKKRVYNLKNYDQRRDAHPEGNVLKHTIAVTNRALKTGDIDFALSALFHDIGKDSTAKLHPKKGFWTHYGHEKVSAQLVKKYATWIKSMGGDVDTIHYIVKQHMRMKVFDKMKWTKQDKMSKEKHFGKLQKFTKFDRGGRGIKEINKTLDLHRESVVYSNVDNGDSVSNLKEEKNIKKVVGVFGGRFQPFHSGHLATYKWLSKQVDEAYITTSDIKKPPRHPMNFKEKVRHMVKVGIPKNRIVMEKSPYVAKNLLNKFDPKTTAVVYVVGEKDAGRLGGKYFKPYTKDMKGFDEHGYIITAPQVGNISGTKTRDMLGNPKVDDKEKVKFFKKTFGYYDKGVYNMMTNKFKKLYEVYRGLLESTGTQSGGVDDGPGFISSLKSYLLRGEKEAGRLGWEIAKNIIDDENYYSQEFDIPKYPNGPIGSVSYGPAGAASPSAANDLDLVGSELWNHWLDHIDMILKNQDYEYTDKLKKSRKSVLKHSKNTLDQLEKEEPTDTDQDRGNEQHDEYDIVKEVYSLTSNLERNGKELLLMGGAYGHMNHPFDDKELTFKDLKKIIELGLGGQLNREDNVTEKTDGQNLMISYKDGKLIAARNKGHLKNKGETALTIKDVENKFKGRGSIRDAFVYAMRDLSKAIGALSKKQQDKIFGNGSKFMSLEVMWPASENVVNYDITELLFHGAIEYDDNGRPIGQAKDSARMLQGMIKQVNQHIQKHYKISKPNFVTVPKHQDFGKMKKKFHGRLSKLQSQYALKDNDTLGLYHQRFWEEYIFNAAKQFKYKIPANVLKRLTMRWAFFDKSYSIRDMKATIKNNKFLEWTLVTEKLDHARMVKDNMKPFEELFFEVGAEIMKNMDGWLAVNPAKSVQNMRKKLKAAISDIRSGGDLKKLNKLKIQLDRLNAIGGFDAIVPTEGLVFKYNGNIYKFTGAFAPINQITGLMFF
jgi:cytidyltransferase-like protein